MTNLNTGIPIERPRRFGLQGVKLDLRKLFLKLAEAIAHGTSAATGKIDSIPKVVTAILGTIEAVNKEAPPEVLGWNLIYRALVGSITELVLDTAVVHNPDSAAIKALSEKCDALLSESDLQLTEDFLSNPNNLPILIPVSNHLRTWGLALGLSKAEAQRLAYRLPAYFVAALREEWRRSYKEYEPLVSILQNPFSAATTREREWDHYRSWLRKQVALPIFGEVFSLSDIYIPLRAYYRDDRDKLETGAGEFNEQLSSRTRSEQPTKQEQLLPADETQVAPDVVVDLNSKILNWLQSATAADPIRIISGGPGSGKSSFVKMLAAELAHSALAKPIFIPLQRFALGADLRDAVGRYLSESGLFKSNPLSDSRSVGDGPYLLIMDGLDELTKPGEQADEVAREFLIELQRSVFLLNTPGLFCLAIVTGRTVAIQKSSSAIRQTGEQELRVMKYVYDEFERKAFSDHGKLLSVDQRKLWWSKYAAAKGLVKQIPKRLLDAELAELSAEPLLNYLLVLSKFHEEQTDAKELNRNSVYKRLLTGVHGRQYESGRFKATQGFTDEEFSQIMETIAVAAWYGDGRTATVEEIREKCTSNKLREIFDAFLSRGSGGINRLIAAFYFQASEKAKRDHAFEFTHKSFGEYLTARRIVRALDRISKDILEDQSEKEAPFDEGSALKAWHALCGQAPIDADLGRFVRDEIRMQEWSTRRSDWQQASQRLVNFAVNRGMPAPSDARSMQSAVQKARNSEEALWCVANWCASVDAKEFRINWPSETSAGALFHRVRSQRWPPDDSVFLTCLSYLNLDEQNLVIQDLYGANLASASLARTKLIKAELGSAMLFAANLSGAQVHRADFHGANLEGATCREIQASDAVFEATSGIKSDWSDARLGDAVLSLSDFDEAMFCRARMENAVLKQGSYRAADFSGANLQEVDFTESDLAGANFENANLQGAIFRRSNLAGARLVNSNLIRANFEGAFIEGADFTNSRSDLGLREAATTGRFKREKLAAQLGSRVMSGHASAARIRRGKR